MNGATPGTQVRMIYGMAQLGVGVRMIYGMAHLGVRVNGKRGWLLCAVRGITAYSHYSPFLFSWLPFTQQCRLRRKEPDGGDNKK